MTNPFVFIVGCPRSGTTVFRRMVDAHPQIAITAEIGWLAQKYEDPDYVTPDKIVKPALVDFLRERNLGRYTRLPIGPQEIDAHLASSGPMKYADFVALLFDRCGALQGKPLVGNKTVENALCIPTLHEVWPRAKFVHLIRDGRDVCLSTLQWRRAPKLAARFVPWLEEPVISAALWWEWHVRCAREAGAALEPHLYYEVSYERLVASPESECRALCRFLDVEFDDMMVRFHETRPQSRPELGAKHGWRPPTRGLRDWRTEMDPLDVDAFQAAAGDLLRDLGYEMAAVPRSDTMARAHRARHLFNGRPLPRRWTAAAASPVAG